MKSYFLRKANENFPKLVEGTKTSDCTVEMYPDEGSYLGVGVRELGTIKTDFVTGDKFVLDFGDHYVGYLSFHLTRVKEYLDAPVRLRLKFGEVPYEIASDFKDYQGGLSSSWLCEEIINVDFPGTCSLPRRYAFRYLEVEVVKTPRPVRLTDFTVRYVTSADKTNLEPLPEGVDPLLVEIDRVGARTLAECMQEVYEDGPKRDRRLWSGDLRLQALTDYCLYKNDALARRCLYLFAACQEEGTYLPGCLFYKPEFHYDEGCAITDYALIYAVSLCDYYKYTKDIETVRDLYPIAAKQVERATSLHDGNGIITLPEGWSSFIDWAQDLKTVTAVEGVYLYSLEKMAELAEAMGETADAQKYREALCRTRRNAYKKLYDDQKKCFCNVYDESQLSVQAQVWMILGGVVEGTEAEALLEHCLGNQDFIQPITPYMHHYLVEAMVRIGMMDQALAFIKKYWGGMVNAGADTFWEVYVPGNPTLSPYGDALINSWCHAWSCSPSYFIRTYFSV